jgi:DNA replication protein DnaC
MQPENNNQDMAPLRDLLPDLVADLGIGEAVHYDPRHLPLAPNRPTQRSSPSSKKGISTASLNAARWGCAVCQDSGWRGAEPDEVEQRKLIVIERYPIGASERLVVICPDCAVGNERAWKWSGLPDDARDVVLDELLFLPDQNKAFEKIGAFVARPTGWLTLAGGYGVGKTTLMYGALNTLAAQGIYGAYWTAPGLIDHLRAGIRDESGNAHSDRLKRVANLPILVVDELDKYYATAFAEYEIFQLFNTRYQLRRTHGTIIGYNLDGAEAIPPFLRSRINDGRFTVVEMRGADIRPALVNEEPTVADTPEEIWRKNP